ncbi:MAG: hypothetical protein MUF71_13455 [Candidatus Kapabacteria bacterium]|jgi:hypothetical protein|nr:hypothetical protein [Candidatus Kapabacteria bacterium]
MCSIKTNAQSITLESGAAAVPTHLPSWTLGGSLQIPITERFSVSAGYYRWADNKEQQAVIDKYPVRDQLHPDYVFPQLTLKNSYWGNNVFALYAHYKPIMTESLSLEIGVGWSFIEYGLLVAGTGIPDAGNNFSRSQLGFMSRPESPSPQRLSGLIQTRYNLSDNFALQGKIAAFGTEHFVATVGISYMPWGSKASLADLFASTTK